MAKATSKTISGTKAKRVSQRRSATNKSSATKLKKSKTATSPSPTRKVRQKREQPQLGRPKISGDEQLFLLFKEDLPARQVFDFLHVHTVRELEQYSPKQIVQRLSKPIMATISRIRRKLAERNRYLNEDAEFAVEFQQEIRSSPSDG